MSRFISSLFILILLVGAGMWGVQTWNDAQSQQDAPTTIAGDYAQTWREAREDIEFADAQVLLAQQAQAELTATGIDTTALTAAVDAALAVLPRTYELGRQSAEGDEQDLDAIAAVRERAVNASDIVLAAWAELAAQAPARAAVLNTPEVIAAAQLFVDEPSSLRASEYAAAEMQARLDVRWNDGQPISLVGNGAAVDEQRGPELPEPAAVAGQPAPIDMTRYAQTSDDKYVPWDQCGNPQGWVKVDPGAGLTATESFPFTWSYQVENGGQGFVAYYVCS